MLNDFLLTRKDQIISRWFDLIVKTYPDDVAMFLQEVKGRFANPVGYTISHAINALYDGLVKGTEAAILSHLLEDIVKIRAVQNLSPSRAISFVILLKKAIQEELKGDILGEKLCGELLQFHSAIDDLALLAFDLYVECREKIYEIRVNEVRLKSFRTL